MVVKVSWKLACLALYLSASVCLTEVQVEEAEDKKNVTSRQNRGLIVFDCGNAVP